MAGSERSGITCIAYESGVTVDVENNGYKIVGRVYTISEVKPEFSEIDLAISIGFPETYVSWLGNSKTFIGSSCLTEPEQKINRIIESSPINTQDIVDNIAKICRDIRDME